MVPCGENILSEKSKTVYSVKVSRLEFVSLPIAEQSQANFYKLTRVEERIIKPDRKNTMHSVIKFPYFLSLYFSV